jgi:hypothetical protein
MTSQLDVRLGSQVPVILHQPPGVVSLAAADEAIELADAYGVCSGFPLSESQKVTLRNALGTRADGRWAASRVANFGPRQGTGKNDAIAARELAGVILFGEKLIIHTAHEFPTANESFLRLVALFDNWDDLGKKVAHTYYANGNQSIVFTNGARILYKTRTSGGQRGFAKADLIVYDEAQHLTAEHTAASGPARLTNPNSQTWYAGSGGLSTSLKTWEIRREAVLGTGGRLAYTEMTAETVEVIDGQPVFSSPPDPLDRDVWYRCMPGLGLWVTEESVEDLYDDLKELFPREGLCVWDPDPTAAFDGISAALWKNILEPDEPGKVVTFALDCTPDRKWGAIAAADSKVVELVAHGKDVGWLVSRAHELWLRHKVGFVVDGSGPAGSLGVEIERLGVPVTFYSSADVVKACNAVYDDIIGARFTVLDSFGSSAAAAAAAMKKRSGDTWRWDRRGGGDISPLMAITFARWAATPPLKRAALAAFG